MPAKKRAMTLSLTEAEMRVVEELAEQKDLTKTGVIRQALRLYQLVDFRLAAGEKLCFEKPGRKEKAEVMVL
jgi:hypothetical protein